MQDGSRTVSVSFAHVLEEAHASADLAYPDQVMPLSRLRMTDDGLVDVAGIGPLELTPWSRMQLGHRLGLRSWLDGPRFTATVNSRLRCEGASVKVRARRRAPGGQWVDAGVLRAIFRTSTAPIDDVRVLESLHRVFGDRADAVRFVRIARTDAVSHFVALTGDDVDLGQDAEDPHGPGLFLVNSEVGGWDLCLYEFLFRVECANGLVGQSAGAILLCLPPKPITDDALDREVARAVARLPERWAASIAVLRRARATVVDNPEDRIRALLDRTPETRPFTERVVAAHREEPMPSRFGVVQAITRAAQDTPPETRLALERFAGRIASGAA